MTVSARLPIRVLVRLAAVGPVLASLTVVSAATRLGPSISGCAQASSVHHAALIVDHSDGSGHGLGPVITVCVPFSEDAITGETLLARSGVQYATGDSGQAVCQIDSEPTSYKPQCLSAGSPYWAMYVSRGGGSWTYSNLGFSAQTFRDGDAEGFRFEGQSDKNIPSSPSGVCPVASHVTPASTRSATPVPPTTGSVTSPPAPASSASARSPLSPPSGVAASSSPSSSATARPAASIVSTNRATPLRTDRGGAWVAGAVAGLLLMGLVAQVARRRRQTPQRPPP